MSVDRKVLECDERMRVSADVFGTGKGDCPRGTALLQSQAIAGEPIYNSMTRKADSTGILADCIDSLK
jgi:hypothetical protein